MASLNPTDTVRRKIVKLADCVIPKGCNHRGWCEESAIRDQAKGVNGEVAHRHAGIVL